MSYANNNGTDQPAHPRSLISAFVVRCLDSVMSLISVTKISNLMLASVAEQEHPEDTFSHDEFHLFLAHMSLAHGRVCSIGKLRRPSVVHTLQKHRWANQSQFHTEPTWDGGTKVCSWGLDHMTKMTATPIYGKTPLKIFSRTKGPMTLHWGPGPTQHWGLGPNKVCSNDDLGLTLNCFYGKVKFASLCF